MEGHSSGAGWVQGSELDRRELVCAAFRVSGIRNVALALVDAGGTLWLDALSRFYGRPAAACERGSTLRPSVCTGNALLWGARWRDVGDPWVF